MTNQPSWFSPITESNTSNQDSSHPSWFTPVETKQFPTAPAEEGEGFLRSAGRYGMQVAKALPLAIPKMAAANFIGSLIQGGTLNEEEIPEEYKRPPMGYIGEEPTKAPSVKRPPSEQMRSPLSQFYSYLEKEHGLPLSPKTESQKTLSIFSDAASTSPGSSAFRGLIGLTASTIYDKAKEIGVGDEGASNLAMLVSQSIAHSGVSTQFQTGREVGKEQTKALVPTQPREMGEGIKKEPKFEMGSYIQENLPTPGQPPQKPVEPPPTKPVKFERPQPPPEYQVTPFVPKEIKPLEGEEHSPVKFNQEVGQIFSNKPKLNSSTSGDYLVKTIADIEKPVRDRITEAYDMARFLRQGQSSEPTELARYVDDRLKNIEEIPENLRTSVQKKAISVLNDIRNQISEVDKEGNILFVKNIPDDVLYNYRQQVSDLADYEFVNPSGKTAPTGEFKQLAENIYDQLEKSAEKSNNIESYEAIRYANNLFRKTWAEPFQNTKILPFRSTEKNISPSQLFNSTENIDTFRALEKALNQSQDPASQNMLQILKRNAVQQHMKQFIENPKNVGSIDYENKINELSSIISPQELSFLDKQLQNRKNDIAQQTLMKEQSIAQQKRQIEIEKAEHKARTSQEILKSRAEKREYERTVKKLEQEERASTKFLEQQRKKEIEENERRFKEETEKHKLQNSRLVYLRNLTPERLVEHSSNVSGLREIQQWVSTQPDGAKIYDEIRRRMAGHVLYNGKEADPSPKDILDILNDTEKRRFLTETMSPKTVYLLQKTAKKLDTISKFNEKKKKILEGLSPKKSYISSMSENLKTPSFYYEEAIKFAKHPELYPFDVFGRFFKGVWSIRESNKYNEEVLKALNEVEREVYEQ